MTGGLPKVIHPRRLAETGACLRGTIPGEALTRIKPLVVSTEFGLDFELEFVRGVDLPAASTLTTDHDEPAGGMSAGRGLGVVGRITFRPEMTCQRCTEPVTVTVESDVRLRFVPLGADDAEQPAGTESDGSWETMEVGDEGVDLVELLENEALLALPDFPKHDDACRIADWIPDDTPTESQPSEQEPGSPFDALEALRGKLR